MSAKVVRVRTGRDGIGVSRVSESYSNVSNTVHSFRHHASRQYLQALAVHEQHSEIDLYLIEVGVKPNPVGA